jgi:hypothetical protein
MSETKTTESNLPQSKVNYTFDETTRQITRTDLNGAEVLCTLDGDVIVWRTEKHKKFHAPVVRFLNDEGIKFSTWRVEGQEKDTVDESKIPPAPKKSKRFGDKTPEYVEWLKRYKPIEYNNRYGIKGAGQVTKIEHLKDARGRPAIRKYKQDAILSRRKIHLTELPDADSQEEGEE